MSTDRPARIDAHHHLWDITVRPQDWTRNYPAIDRTFTMDDLRPHLAAAGVDGTVLVETINVAPETPELLDLAAADPTIRGVVGWVDLTRDDVADQVARLRDLPGGERLVGIRHQVQGEPDAAWLTRPDVLHGLRAVAEAGLVFDLLVLHHQLPAAIEAVRRTPQGRFVLDHIGKPSIAEGHLEPWASRIDALAAHDNVACKLSGMVTEASRQWSVTDLVPFAMHVLSQFGPDRVMAGSDWPVCLLRGDYEQVWDTGRALVAELSAAEQDLVLGEAAMHWYRLS